MRSDEDLMADYLRDDQAAFRELFSRYAPALGRFLQRHVGNGADAQELVQQTFLQLHRARHDFTGGRRLRPWVMTIAANLARDLLRRRGRHAERELDDEVAAPAVDPGQGMIDAVVRTAVATLPATLRTAVELHWFEGLSFDEIAERLRVRPGTVRVRAHRGYAALRRAMA
jgi:RNA polymerase sigma-70 factor (ECF subfamily)